MLACARAGADAVDAASDAIGKWHSIIPHAIRFWYLERPKLEAELAAATAERDALQESLLDFLADFDNACIEQRGDTITLLFSRNNDTVTQARAAIDAAKERK